ncbi:MAG: ABC transporter permease [Planctomycetota bacterium]
MNGNRTWIRPRAEPLRLHLRPAEMFGSLWANRHVIAQLGRRNVQIRHRGSFLGVLWTLLNPLLLLGVYTLVFTVFLPVAADGPARAEFVLRVFGGIVVFGVFSETVNRAATVVAAHPSFVKKVVFPLEALVVADLFASAVLGAVNLGVLFLAVAALEGTVHWTWILVPLIAPALLLLTLGAGWIVAALGVYIKDVGAAIGVVMTILFFVTPIFYRLDDVGEPMRTLLGLNPLAAIVESFRASIVLGRPPDALRLLLVTAASLVAAQLGFALFRAAKRGFADVL